MTATLAPMPVADRWCVHAYYTVCPEAPDGSGRILVAGGDLARNVAEVLVLDRDGQVLDRFGQTPIEPNFFHTGLWQTWSPDAKSVYFQVGSLRRPRIARFDLETRRQHEVDGDMEGAPPDGEPLIAGLHGMLYAAGYGDGKYKPDASPVPFQARDQHGLFEYRLDPPAAALRVSTRQILDRHPDRDRLLAADAQVKAARGPDEGLTLMAYCVRWAPDGRRLLFYVGNHTILAERGEPRIGYVMTADRSLSDLHLAIDLSFGRKGVHWGWQPDGERLIGYGPRPEDPTKMCLAEVRYDGSGYRVLGDHATGGHPSVSPSDDNLIVTDAYGDEPTVDFIDRRTGQVTHRTQLRAKLPGAKGGRHAGRIDLHPVFSRDGRSVFCQALVDGMGVLHRLKVPR
jgi:hypothetical protein